MLAHRTNMLTAGYTTLIQCTGLWPTLQLDTLLSRQDLLRAEQIGCAPAQLAGQFEALRGEMSNNGKSTSNRALVWMQVMLCPRGIVLQALLS